MPSIKKQIPDDLNSLGFTIIELQIVFIIISIIVAMAVPNFNKILGNYQLDISAREMASDIRDLQQTAVKTQSSTYSIMWNLNTDTYYLCNPGTTAYKTVNLPSSVDLVNAPVTGYLYKLGFAASGRPNYGFGGTVTLMDRTSGKYKFVVIDTLGRVRVSETYPAS